MERSRLELYNISDPVDLRALVVPDIAASGVVKCRVVYGPEVLSVDFLPYTPKPVRSLAVAVCDDIDYAHKFTDRSRLEELQRAHPEADDIIVVRDGLLTDASYANIALFDGARWITPARPLLRGTRRERLLREGRIVEEDIRLEDLHLFRVVSLFNAMLDLGEVEIPASGIFYP
ncbi:MAG: aminotransferase class IV [Ignavibacteria bacterium]|nr:aminotransferase class IV [Ignavibacteria bacterium]